MSQPIHQAICLQCGTSEQDQEYGICINGHDDWLEIIDDAERFTEASKRFKMSIGKIKDAILSGMSIETSKQRTLVSKINSAANAISKARESFADHIVVSHEYLQIVMKNNDLKSEKEATDLLIEVMAGTKTMKHV